MSTGATWGQVSCPRTPEQTPNMLPAEALDGTTDPALIG